MDLSQRKLYLGLYCCSFFSMGLFTGSTGPLIPFLAQQRGVPATSFSFLFVARTLGSVFAFMLYRYIQQKYENSEHRIIAGGAASLTISMLIFVNVPGTFIEWLTFSIMGGAYYTNMTATNICIVRIAQEKAKTWVPFGHGMFGLGALVAAINIKAFGINAFLVLSVLYLAIITVFLSFITPVPPEDRLLEKKKDDAHQWLDGSDKLQHLLSFGFFLIVGLQQTVTGWFPTYGVVQGVADMKSAAFCGTMFWTLSTIFRFLNSMLPIKISLKLKVMLIASCICGGMCLLFHLLNFKWLVLNAGSFFFGVATSGIYPSMLSIPTQFWIRFRPVQTANMMMATVIAIGTLAGLTGKLMTYNIDFLLYSSWAMCIAMLVNYHFIMKEMYVIANKNQESQRISSTIRVPKPLQELKRTFIH